MCRQQEGRTGNTAQQLWASQPALFPTPPSLSPSFALRWKVNVIGHIEVQRRLSVVANKLLSVRRVNVMKNGKIYTKVTFCLQQTEEEIHLLHVLLSHVKHFVQGTRGVTYVRLRNCDAIESFCRLIKLQQSNNQPAEVPRKEKGICSQLFLQHGSVVDEFLILGSGYIWHLKYTYIFNNFCFSLGLRLQNYFVL